MSDIDLTHSFFKTFYTNFNLTEEEKNALSVLQFRKEDDDIKVQGEYGDKEAQTICKYWEQVKTTLVSITGCHNISDNRVYKGSELPAGNHCYMYVTTGPLKPVEWEFVPQKNLSQNEIRRAALFNGHYVRLGDKKSAHSLWAEENSVSAEKAE